MWKSMQLVRAVCNELATQLTERAVCNELSTQLTERAVCNELSTQLTEQRFRHIVQQAPLQVIKIESLVESHNLRVAEDPFLVSEYLPVLAEDRESKITGVFYSTDQMAFRFQKKEDDKNNEPAHEKVPIARPGPEAPAPALDQPPDPFPGKVIPRKKDKGGKYKNNYSSTAHPEISCGGYFTCLTRNGPNYV